MDKPQRHEDAKINGIRPLAPDLGPLSRLIVDAAFKVRSTLGPGLLESAYEHCLCHEFKRRGVPFRSQLSLPVLYDGISIETGLRIDLVVDERIIVELQAAEEMCLSVLVVQPPSVSMEVFKGSETES